jgi:hypothetical protein
MSASSATNGGNIIHLQPTPAWGLTDEQIADVRAKHPRLGQIQRSGRYQIVFRAPKRAEYKRFRAQANEPARRAEAQELLARAVVVAVWWQGRAHVGEGAARDALDGLLEEYPAAVDSAAASEVIEKLMSGAVADEEKD